MELVIMWTWCRKKYSVGVLGSKSVDFRHHLEAYLTVLSPGFCHARSEGSTKIPR